jgi:hypothetical protein
LLSKPAVESGPAVAFRGKLSALYSSGLADERGWNERGWNERGWNERGWKRGKRLGGPTRRRRKTEFVD